MPITYHFCLYKCLNTTLSKTGEKLLMNVLVKPLFTAPIDSLDQTKHLKVFHEITAMNQSECHIYLLEHNRSFQCTYLLVIHQPVSYSLLLDAVELDWTLVRMLRRFCLEFFM